MAIGGMEPEYPIQFLAPTFPSTGKVARVREVVCQNRREEGKMGVLKALKAENVEE